MLVRSEITREVFGPAGIGHSTFVSNDVIAVSPAEVTHGRLKSRNHTRHTTGEGYLLALTVDACCSGTGVVVIRRTVGIFNTATTALLRHVLTGVINVTEVGRTGITVRAVLVGLAARIVDDQVTLSGRSTLPDIAGRVAIGVLTALNGEQLRRTTLGTTFSGVFMDALSVDTRVGRTRRIIIAVSGDVTATFDRRVVANIVSSTLVFGTRVTVVTVGFRQAAIELFWVIAVTRGKVANFQSTGITVGRTIRVLLTTTRREGVDTFLRTNIALIGRTDITVVARCVSRRTVIGVGREDTCVGSRFTDIERRGVTVVALGVGVTALTHSRRIENRDTRVTLLGIGIAGVDGTNIRIIAIRISDTAVCNHIGTEAALVPDTTVEVTGVTVVAL